MFTVGRRRVVDRDLVVVRNSAYDHFPESTILQALIKGFGPFINGTARKSIANVDIMFCRQILMAGCWLKLNTQYILSAIRKTSCIWNSQHKHNCMVCVAVSRFVIISKCDGRITPATKHRGLLLSGTISKQKML